MKLLKHKATFVATLMVMVIVTAIPVFASDDNIPFKFHLQLNGANSYVSDNAARYRQTTNISNPWKVQVTTQTGDTDNKATYWLAKKASSSHAQVSDAHNVERGSGAHYYNARNTANETWIVLGADNNNNVASMVEGFWDEETY